MYSDNWSGTFLKEKLSNFDKIQKIGLIASNLLEVQRKKGKSFFTFTMSLKLIELNDIKEILENNSNLNFIVNIKKEYRISGSAISYLNSKSVSFGGMGDIMRFSNQRDNSLYVDKEYSFVQRGLSQHTKVKSLERLDNKRIKIERYSMKEVIAVMNNDYDLGSESVRSYKDRFKDFKVIICTNPNARVTSEADSIANSLKIDICAWGDLLGKLNTFWK